MNILWLQFWSPLVSNVNYGTEKFYFQNILRFLLNHTFVIWLHCDLRKWLKHSLLFRIFKHFVHSPCIFCVLHKLYKVLYIYTLFCLFRCTWKVKVKSLSCVQIFVTPLTIAYHAPPSMGFSRQEYWSGLPKIYMITLFHLPEIIFPPHSVIPSVFLKK